MPEIDFLSSTRESYDAVAVEYDDQFRDDLASKPWDRAVLAAFAELVRADGHRPVADVGCGPGRVTHHLRGLGLDTFGIDLSPGMIAVARQAYPGIPFHVGSMLALDLADGSVGGLVAYYSTIHVPDDLLPQVFAEFERVLAPGGHLLLVFQIGEGLLHLSEALGRPVVLDFHRRRPEQVAGLLGAAGLAVRTQVQREPEVGERTAQAYLVARKPSGP